MRHIQHFGTKPLIFPDVPSQCTSWGELLVHNEAFPPFFFLEISRLALITLSLCLGAWEVAFIFFNSELSHQTGLSKFSQFYWLLTKQIRFQIQSQMRSYLVRKGRKGTALICFVSIALGLSVPFNWSLCLYCHFNKATSTSPALPLPFSLPVPSIHSSLLFTTFLLIFFTSPNLYSSLHRWVKVLKRDNMDMAGELIIII